MIAGPEVIAPLKIAGFQQMCPHAGKHGPLAAPAVLPHCAAAMINVSSLARLECWQAGPPLPVRARRWGG